MHSSLNTLTLAHQFVEAKIKKGDTVIDATCGKGRDTLFLSTLVGAEGRVLAFDIQETAVNLTKALLAENGRQNVDVILDSHENMDKYVKNCSVDGIMFNFGWLPGGDHDIFSTGDTSVKAIGKGLELLKPGGIMSLCIYYGRNNGYAERDKIFEYIKTIDQEQYTVITAEFSNRRGEPPIPVFIIKD